MRMRTRIVLAATVGISFGWLMEHAAQGAAAPTVEDALQLRPSQSDVEYDIPDPATVKQCKINVERLGQGSGWVITGPAGETLRRFDDTNGDNLVDQYRYFLRGIEVYRDIDSNFDKKVDQSRWMNTAGTRWGQSTNQDG